MGVMAESAEHVLAAKATLRLSADQEQRITGIRDAARTDHDAAMRDARRHGEELDDVMKAPAPDTAAMKMHFNGAFTAMGQAHLSMLRSAALTRAALTDAQRRQVDSLRTAMGCGMMGGSGSQQPAHAH
jgi:Spy/CpxP family protein refolding chaperone